jgi:hypothetical protein
MRKSFGLISTLVLLGCSSNDFNTPQLLNVPRVLAIQAEPPQPQAGTSTTLRTLIYLPPGDLGESASYAWSWCPLPTSSNNNYQCPIDQDQFDAIYASFGLGAAPSLNLGTGKTATLVNPFPASVLAGLCRGDVSFSPSTGALSPDAGGKSMFNCPDGNGGFPVTIKLSVGPTSAGNLDAVYLVYLPTDDSVPGNLNPVVGRIQATWPGAPDAGATGDSASQPDDAVAASIDAEAPALDAGEQAPDGGGPALDAGEPALDSGVSALDGGPSDDGGTILPQPDASAAATGPDDPADWVVLDDVNSTLLPRQKRVLLHVQIPRQSSEPLTVAQLAAVAAEYASENGGKVDPKRKLTEKLDLAWFAEAGDFGSDGNGGHRTGFLGLPDDVDSPFSGATDNKWTLPKVESYGASTTKLILVVRDNRGGVAWTTGSATLEPTP